MAQTTTPVPQLLQGFTAAIDSIQKQLSDGIVQPVLPLHTVTLLGGEGLASLHQHVQNSCKAEFLLNFNVSANSITFIPTAPMAPKSKTTKAVASKDASDRVPRPPNAFIIYRKDWHPRIVAENPGLHNNAISVILGNQWRHESEAVRAAYKQKADEVKRQHELAHPEYQYQPRKPSEKKRRMTKNKLAKLVKAQAQANVTPVAQQTLPDDFDPLAMLDDTLTSYIGGQTMQVTQYGTDPSLSQPELQTTSWDSCMAFDSGADVEGRLLASLQRFNEHNTPPAPAMPATWPVGTPTAVPPVSLGPSPSAMVAEPLVNGVFKTNVKTFAMPRGKDTKKFMTLPWSDKVNNSQAATQGAGPLESLSATALPQAYQGAEVARQDNLADEAFSAFIDLSQFGSSPSPGHYGPAGFTVGVLTDSELEQHSPDVAGDVTMPTPGPLSGMSDFDPFGDMSHLLNGDHYDSFATNFGIDFSDSALNFDTADDLFEAGTQ
ncbi:hypothetical protein LTR62_004638 [Meristemomyces frigidus]|uniref:HMG box domain-containing protein n=1 Tax=Meristemomyces frigidus TaxID=1508187 RepID=A0AAN7TLV1_9PEZI|nr:hypothetical protein LTR62_004638 [Meristemomyces frigidus]